MPKSIVEYKPKLKTYFDKPLEHMEFIMQEDWRSKMMINKRLASYACLGAKRKVLWFA